MTARPAHLLPMAIAAACVIALQPLSGRAQTAGPSPVEVARTSVVSVLPQWPGRPPNADEPEGSGVVLGDARTIITADHVLGPEGTPSDLLVRDSDGTIYRARILMRNKLTDVAVLATDADLVPASRRAEPAAVGEQVCAIGNAFGLGLSVTCGHVSAVHRAGVGFNGVEDFIQTDAAVNPGMSGGALIDGQGRLLGILSAIFTKQADANIGVNFAVDMSLVDAVLAAAKTGEPFVPFRTGVLARPVPPRGEAGREGLLVARVVAGSAAEMAGLAPGDVIYRAGQRRIRKVADWVSVTASVARGTGLEIEVIREGKPVRRTLQRN